MQKKDRFIQCVCVRDAGRSYITRRSENLAGHAFFSRFFPAGGTMNYILIHIRYRIYVFPLCVRARVCADVGFEKLINGNSQKKKKIVNK